MQKYKMGNAKNKEVANPALKDVDSTTKASKGKTENEGKAYKHS